MTEFFAQPDDMGELRASELHSSLAERLGAQAGEAFMGGSRTLFRLGQYAIAGGEGIPGLTMPEDPSPLDVQNAQAVRASIPDVPIADAKARVKQEGLESRFKLPEQDTIKAPVLDLMIQHAHERRQYEAAVSRGPQGFLPGALGMATEIGAGIIDPVNIAAFSIPVVGEARLGMLMARAGESLGSRALVRAGVGAGQGAVGTTALQPADWWLHTRDGVDYTMADALHSIALGAGMGAAFHAGLGAIGDVRARRRGEPLEGARPSGPAAPETLQGPERPLVEQTAGAEEVPGISPASAQGAAAESRQPALDALVGRYKSGIGDHSIEITQLADGSYQARVGITQTAPGSAKFMERILSAEMAQKEQPGDAAASIETPEFAPLPRPEDLPPDHPAFVLADLPPRAREDVTRAAIADVISGNAVRGAELLHEAAKESPRIAESIEAWHGSPHDFDRFDMSKLGTGEGAQSYGRGLYFAEEPNVAAQYSKTTSYADFIRKVRELYDQHESPDEARRLLAESKDFTPGQKRLLAALEKDDWFGFDYPHQAVAAAVKEVHNFDPSPETLKALESLGNLYKVKINANRDHFLDWDRPLSEQSAHVKDALRKILKTEIDWSQSGENFVRSLGSDPGGQNTKLMLDAGILGIKYFDQGSRASLAAKHPDAKVDLRHEGGMWNVYVDGALENAFNTKLEAENFAHGTRNIVVFDDKHVEITHKNGEPVSRGERAEILREKRDNPAGADVVQGPRAARGPRARDPETWSLGEFIASRGGIDPNDPMIGDLRGSIGTTNKFVPGFGHLIRKGGMKLDEAREAAVEAGYLRDHGADAGRESTTDVRTLLEAMDRELRGERVYREGKEPVKGFDAEQNRIDIEREAHGALKDDGIDPAGVPDKTMARVVEIMEREGERDALHAYERAVMEETHYGAETGVHQRIAEPIAGWDVPDDAGAASRTGGAAAAGGERAAGAGARQPGGGDRAAAQADWQRLESLKRAGDEDLAEASKEATRTPEPESIEPERALTAAEKAAAEADKLLEDIRSSLTEEERALFDERLAELASDREQREQIIRDGAACLMAAVA